jgi:hypothetical protein
MLCPIGFDFVEPIPDLVALLDRYNRNHYPTTGVWAINAGLDDYLALVEGYQDRLPLLELDPNPYWSGFYTARPGLKKQCRELVEELLLAERLSLLPENRGAEQAISKELEDAWWRAAVSNHHDFITGTSPDEIVEGEQIPWLEQATTAARTTTDRLASALPVPGITSERPKLPAWSQQEGHVQIETAHYIVELGEDVGGAVVSMRALDGQTLLLVGISNDLISYRDSGGLWRMGFEFWGGTWKKAMQASDRSTQLQVRECANGLEITSSTALNGETICRRMRFSNDSPVIRCRVEGRAAEGYSTNVRFTTGLSSSKLVMDAPGGIVIRPPKRIYDPTFWPLQQFAHVQNDSDGRGLAILQAMPGAISYQPDGSLELVALRNATRERIFGLIGIPGNPASGHERGSYAFDYALFFTPSGDWRDNDIPSVARSTFSNPWDDPERATLHSLVASAVTTDCPEVWVTAVKPASRGEGVIVRLHTPALLESPVMVTSHHFKEKGACLCDARERDLWPLEVQDGTVRVALPGTIATIRLL